LVVLLFVREQLHLFDVNPFRQAGGVKAAAAVTKGRFGGLAQHLNVATVLLGGVSAALFLLRTDVDPGVGVDGEGRGGPEQGSTLTNALY
jgi:hypothetical protein